MIKELMEGVGIGYLGGRMEGRQRRPLNFENLYIQLPHFDNFSESRTPGNPKARCPRTGPDGLTLDPLSFFVDQSSSSLTAISPNNLSDLPQMQST